MFHKKCSFHVFDSKALFSCGRQLLFHWHNDMPKEKVRKRKRRGKEHHQEPHMNALFVFTLSYASNA